MNLGRTFDIPIRGIESGCVLDMTDEGYVEL